MELDLHGLDEISAISKLQLTLLAFSENDYENELRVMTGKGTGVIMSAVEDYLTTSTHQWRKIASDVFMIEK